VSEQTVQIGSLRPRLADDERLRLQRRARQLAWGGIAWHVIEFAIALAAGLAAGSIALVAFGADSLIEALAGFVVLWLFTGSRVESESAERRAQQLIAGSFFVLCAYLSVALLVGLLANALAGWWWADPLAALFIAGVAAREGRQAWRGEGCCDYC
jgi:divalent metal cation (Fe/Co/Zn/Cd) transporter